MGAYENAGQVKTTFRDREATCGCKHILVVRQVGPEKCRFAHPITTKSASLSSNDKGGLCQLHAKAISH